MLYQMYSAALSFFISHAVKAMSMEEVGPETKSRHVVV